MKIAGIRFCSGTWTSIRQSDAFRRRASNVERRAEQKEHRKEWIQLMNTIIPAKTKERKSCAACQWAHWHCFERQLVSAQLIFLNLNGPTADTWMSEISCMNTTKKGEQEEARSHSFSIDIAVWRWMGKRNAKSRRRRVAEARRREREMQLNVLFDWEHVMSCQSIFVKRQTTLVPRWKCARVCYWGDSAIHVPTETRASDVSNQFLSGRPKKGSINTR